MPVDNEHSRFGSGERRGALGTARTWNCAGCGIQVTGRTIEQGCPHCGAGDPSKAKGGRPQEPLDRMSPEEVDSAARPRPVLPKVATPPPLDRQPGITVIYRLIEYMVKDPKLVGSVLRNSLVGTLEMGWGTLTGCIVDTTDPQQEDRLRMARMQPGVWLANPQAVANQDVVAQHTMAPLVMRHEQMGIRPRDVVLYGETPGRPEKQAGRPFVGRSDMADTEMPDTGPAYTTLQKLMAEQIVKLVGYQTAHTLALGLSNVAEELDANIEPEKYLSSQDALALANAILNSIPQEWLDAQQAPPAEEGIGELPSKS